jgi:hypothetical protein
MSSGSERMIEMQREKADRRLAQKLGITYDELLQLDHEIDTEESNDGMIYNYIVEFNEDASREILNKIEGLEDGKRVWLAPWELNDDYYYEEQYLAIISNKHYYESFLQAISSLDKLNNVDIDGGLLTNILKRQIYISVIGAVEAFLSETFINLTYENDLYFRNFIETFPDFKEKKIELCRIFVEQELIKETAKKVMVEIIYHNLSKVSKMYSSTFNIEFPDFAELSKSVSIRHDLVHRNGKTNKGEIVRVDKDAVNNLIKKSSSFVDDIAKKLKIET